MIDDAHWKDLDSGDIHVRDKWQYEVKSKFVPLQALKENVFHQEFYLFVPNSLQINHLTYSKEQFYQDQTTLIRFKTPEFSLHELLNPYNHKSPLNRIQTILNKPHDEETRNSAEDELKLLGNIARSAIRDKVFELILLVDQPSSSLKHEELTTQTSTLCNEITLLKESYRKSKDDFLNKWSDAVLEISFLYVEEFIGNAVHYYLIILLDHMRKHNAIISKELESQICKHLIEEIGTGNEQTSKSSNPEQEEMILYRNSLLNKFIVDALLLRSSRFSLEQRFSNIISSFAAGIAMLIYVLLIVWQGELFVINSAAFVLITVILYILKDRLKEQLKSISYHHALKWFSDYTTEIQSPNGKYNLGKLKESFSFIDESSLPDDIQNIRKREFYSILEAFTPPESIIYYKRIVAVRQMQHQRESRRHGLNMIFRFNISQFLSKASNPYHLYKTLDPNTLKIIHKRLPKVYHLNILMKTTFQQENQVTKSEIKKFRLIVDKNGIKRIEQIDSH